MSCPGRSPSDIESPSIPIGDSGGVIIILLSLESTVADDDVVVDDVLVEDVSVTVEMTLLSMMTFWLGLSVWDVEVLEGV